MMMHAMDWVLLALVLTCGITDIFRDRIYNPVTYSGILSGLLVAALGHGAVGLNGLPITVGDAVFGFLVGFVPFLVLFLIGGTGGGDVKLMGAIGAIKGPHFVAYTMLYSLFLAAVIGIVQTAYRGELKPMLKRVGYTILHTLTPTVGPVSHLDMRGPKVNTGIAICFGTALCLVGQLLGYQILDF